MESIMSTAVEDRVRDIIKVSGENYLSPEFAQKEKAHLWTKVWQVACREEEIPKSGDYLVYEVADETIVVVRRPDGGIKAFHNVCPHRGRKIMAGCGHAVNFRCAYHNWTFDLDGKNVAVQDREDWAGTLEGERLDLYGVKTGTWGGFVWINMDPESETLEDYLETIPQMLDPFEYEKLRYRWYLELTLPCNWKVAQEAFMEGYHVAGTHPQLLPYQGDDYTQSYAQGKHGHFGYWESTQPLGMPSPRLKKATPADVRPGIVEFFRQMEEDFAAIFTDRDYEASKKIMDVLPADTDAMTAFGTAVELGRQAADAEGAGYPPNLDYEAMGKAGTDWHIFPNCVTLPWFDGAVWYRARPNGDDPNSCIFNIWSLKRYAPGAEPTLERRVIKDPTGMSFGLIVDQDLANMNAVQKGMKSSAFKYAKPNPKQEMEVINFHRTLEQYILGQEKP
jgi:phenylpropionate dioxygenase-like ring-hydroxylating dioxygenase large terminal subunit